MSHNSHNTPKRVPNALQYKSVLAFRLFVALLTLVLVIATSGVLGFGGIANAEPTTAGSQDMQKAATKAQAASSATVLIYMNGSDLESEGAEATSDIDEMLASGIGNNANVVIQTMGTREWQGHGIASDHSQRYVVKDGELVLVDDSLGQLDTTESKTLSDFIRWGVENYPADRYMLIMWNHGAGPVYGFGYDEWQGDYAALTLDEMKQALEENKNVHFDFIGMDCCIMSSLETYYVLYPFCDYAILSEDFEPGVGWSYTNWMSMLEKNLAIDTTELGTAIVDDMIRDVEADPENGDATLALVDSSAVPALYDAWIDFAYENKDALLETNYSQETSQHGRFSQGGHTGTNSGWGMQDMGNVTSTNGWNGGDGCCGENDWCGDGGNGGDAGDWYGNGGNGGNGGNAGHGNNGGNGGQDDWYGNDNGGQDSWYGNGGQDGWFGSDDWYGNGGQDGWYGSDDWYDMWDADASYVTMSDYFVTDIMTVASSIDSTKAEALENALNKAMVHYGRTSGETAMTGIGVTLPYGDAEFYDQLKDVFEASGIDKDYVGWLEAFVEADGVNDYYDYESFDETWQGWDTYPLAA